MVEGQPVALKEKLKKIGKGASNVVADSAMSYGLPAITGFLIWEITKDPAWTAGAAGLQILVLKSILGIDKETEKQAVTIYKKN